MFSRKTNWAALLIGLVVLVAAAAAMTLNPAGLTGAIHGFEFQTLQRLFPAMTNGAAAAPLIATTNTNVSAAPWLANAAALWPQLLFLLIAGLIVVSLLGRYRSILATLFTVVAIAAALGAEWLLFTGPHLFVPVLAACFGLMFTFALGLLAAGLQPAVRERPLAVRDTAPPSVATEPIAADRTEVRGERRTVTCVVCRIGGLNEFAESMEPDGLLRLAHDTARPLNEAVAACGGTMVHSGAGNFMAAWNVLSSDAEPAAHACDAGLRISAAIREIQDQHGEGTPYERLRLEIGIATGAAVVTGDGSPQSPVAIFGQCGERAEQLSRLCGRYGAPILIDEPTRDAVASNFAVLQVDTPTAWPGSATPIYALYGNPVVRASPRFQGLSICNDHLFRALHERRWADARTVATQCRDLSGAIPSLYDPQLARLDWYEQHPPPADWDGVFRPPIA